MNGSKPEYITKQIAARQLGLSERRVLELAQKGKIKRHLVKNPDTGHRQVLLSASDVARLRGIDIATGALGSRENGAVMRAARTLAALPPHDVSTIPQRPWLTLAEAEDYSGLPRSFLDEYIRAGKLPALDVGVRPGGRWRVSRRDLDAIKAPAAKR